MKIEYVPKKFNPDHLAVISRANTICADYARQGYDLTLRQLYYQFVARGLIANRDSEYKRLGSIINDARLAGLLDWDYIVDRTRNVRSLSHWNDPTSVLRSAAASYRTDKWAEQPTRVEVWIEKDALIGVLDNVCPELDVPYFSCRGYTSQSEIWGAAQRLGAYMWKGQNVVVLHLGDHDPSGIDMTRDIRDRLKMFTNKDRVAELTKHLRRWQGAMEVPEEMEKGTPEYAAAVARLDRIGQGYGSLEVRRIALTMDQIEEYNPPPNPAKLTDARAVGYIEEYGDSSWELDALDPATLSDLIREHVGDLRDDDVWDEAEEHEETQRDYLKATALRWSEIVEMLGGAAATDDRTRRTIEILAQFAERASFDFEGVEDDIVTEALTRAGLYEHFQELRGHR